MVLHIHYLRPAYEIVVPRRVGRVEPARDVLFEYHGEWFEWDGRKAALNVANHGITFEEAATAFADPNQLVDLDEAHSYEEIRSLLVGRSAGGWLLLVAWTLRGDRIRLISARTATPTERRRYEERDRAADR